VTEFCLNCGKPTATAARKCGECGVSRRLNRWMGYLNLPTNFLKNKIEATTSIVRALTALLLATGALAVAYYGFKSKYYDEGPVADMSRPSIEHCGRNCVDVSFVNAGKGEAKIEDIEVTVETLGVVDGDRQVRPVSKTPTMADLEKGNHLAVKPNTTWRQRFVAEEFTDFYPEALPDPTVVRSCKYHLKISFVDETEKPLEAQGPCYN